MIGSIAGLASLVSYPAMLALGVGPLAANVINIMALLTNGVGSAAGSRIELRGQGPRLLTLVTFTGLGGAIGAVLLLVGSFSVFADVVPWLVAFGGVLLLSRDGLRAWLKLRRDPTSAARTRPTRPWFKLVPIVLVGIYSGYFGAGAGIIMFAVLSIQLVEPLPVTNAVKNVGQAASNGVAAVVYAFVAPVDWPAAAALAIGILCGSWWGPAIVRVLPEREFRIAVALRTFVLAAALLADWL